MNSVKGILASKDGFPHSEIFGSMHICRLPEAYRRLPRPSSPSVAKASTMCAYSLDHITPSDLESYKKSNQLVLECDISFVDLKMTSTFERQNKLPNF